MSKLPLIAALSLFLSASLHAATEPNWEKLEGCTLGDTKYADGDSFHVKCKERDLIIRLYFVDTPEHSGDQRFPDRIAEQANYFGISSSEVLKVGDAAQAFTMKTLGTAPFTVYTCGQDAMHGRFLRTEFRITEIVVGAIWVPDPPQMNARSGMIHPAEPPW